jgi:hypothetical protein
LADQYVLWIADERRRGADICCASEPNEKRYGIEAPGKTSKDVMLMFHRHCQNVRKWHHSYGLEPIKLHI